MSRKRDGELVGEDMVLRFEVGSVEGEDAMERRWLGMR